MYKEQWLTVPGYEGLYSVSNLSRVRRDLLEKQSNPNGILTQSRIKGYFRVTLCNSGEKTIKVHRLVASAFIGPCPTGFQVNHIDGNKDNNLPSNLEYVSPKQNSIHASRIGLKPRGDHHWKSKLTSNEVIAIRSEYATGKIFQKTLAEKYKVTQMLISKIICRQIWQHL